MSYGGQQGSSVPYVNNQCFYQNPVPYVDNQCYYENPVPYVNNQCYYEPYVNNQYYYENRPNDYRDVTEPRPLELLEDFRELHNQRHELFLKIFPRSLDEFGSTLARSKRKRRVETVQRSLRFGSPHVSHQGVGDGCEETLRLEWFKVKTVDLEDDEVGAGGGQGATKKKSIFQ